MLTLVGGLILLIRVASIMPDESGIFGGFLGGPPLMVMPPLILVGVQLLVSSGVKRSRPRK